MSGESLTVTAPAKINLYLKVTGRRADGYHYLATLMQKIGLADQLVLQKRQTGIRLVCPDSDLPVGQENIAYRAAQLFFDTLAARLKKNTGLEITLYKTIPVAAGLGGGSSNAAAILCGLDRLYDTKCSVDELTSMGVSLGADVPLFIVNWPVAWATGIGDRLRPAIPLRDYRILLVNPGYPVSTKWIYSKFALTAGENIYNLKNSQKESLAQGKGVDFTVRSIVPEELENDLETVTVEHNPDIVTLKNRLLIGGASASLMSGSGPTVFGLFAQDKNDMAAACYEELKSEYSNTFLVDPLT